MILRDIILVVASFFCGAIPFAVLVGNMFLQDDIRRYGDGNPGAFNVLRAGGKLWGALAIFLEMSKAAVPVGLANYVFHVSDVALVIISLAAPLGHAYSPFLGGDGGKAIAASGGVLIGLSLWELPLVAMIMLVYWYTSLTSSGWAVMFTIASTILYILIGGRPVIWLLIGILLAILLAWRHKAELSSLPRFKVSPLLRPFLDPVFDFAILFPPSGSSDDNH